MYLLNKAGILNEYTIRGIYLTKKKTKKWKKQTLVYLRSPKHFNIGKHKILSFNTNAKYKYILNMNINYLSFIKNKNFINLYSIFHKINILYRINSIKTKIKTKVYWK